MYPTNVIRASRRRRAALLATAAVCLLAPAAYAQDAAPADDAAVEEIVVTGIRATQRNSVETKRNATVVVDALVNDEIGALPDQSVGETLERITGVTADRFKGSASEISVRGLGPFLGFSTLNGREVSSGSGDRAVSFQQFPSELVNGVLVYKTQQADFVEGGISGVIELRTLRPLDSGKRRFQAEVRGVYNENDARIRSRDGIGGRGSLSYVDQFETAIGDIGVAIGLSKVDSTQPEDFYTASSDFRPCNTVNTTPTAVTGGLAGTNCSFNASSSARPYFVANQYSFRQLLTDDDREAFMGALQWKPNDQLDFNLDVQLSSRESTEDRHDLALAEGRRGINPTLIGDNGALLTAQGNSYIENVSTLRNRVEDYEGVGFSGKWTGDRLTLTGDASYSKTHRNQVDLSTRLRSNTLFGPSGRVAYSFDQRGDVPSIIFATPTNLNDHNAYTMNAYARRRMEDRTDEIKAIRFDGAYDLGGVIERIKAGVRFSDHDRSTDLGNNNDLDPVTGAAVTAANANCRIQGFNQDDYFEGKTNITSWAQFDSACMYRTLTGVEDRGPVADGRTGSDIDVNEKIWAGYAMAEFASSVGSTPFTGNVGVRVVQTKVDSRGFRGTYTARNTDGTISLIAVPGTFDEIQIKHDYVNVLPSANVAFDLRDDLKLRLAVYKAIARSNIEDLGAGRDLIVDSGALTVPDAIAGITGGNPRLEPLESWNYDLSLEWYVNPDTSFSAAVYYKKLSAGIIPAAANALIEPITIDGVTYQVPVAQEANSDDTSDLYGFELTAQHAFTELPAPFDGLGVIGSYSFADSNFEYPDPSAVDPLNPMANFTDPTGIIGLSRHTGSATVYWEKGPASVRAVYKYRSGYFKPSGLTAIRTVEDAGFLDLSASYDLTKNIQLKAQAINVLDQDQVMYRPVTDSIAETSNFGTSYMFGIRFRY